MATSIYSKKNPIWQVKQVGRSTRLYSSDTQFLKRTWESISIYTQKVDSQFYAPTFQAAMDMDNNGRVYTDLTGILPEPVRIWLGDYPDDEDNGVLANSHGAALVAAGVFPAMSYLDSPDSLPGCTLKELPPNSKASPGDIILYDTNPIFFSQSCVYINNDLCFTMGVFDNTFTIHSFSEIEALHAVKGVSAAVRLFQRVEDWEIPPELQRAYGLKENVVRMRALYEEIAEQLLEKREAWLMAAESIQKEPLRPLV